MINVFVSIAEKAVALYVGMAANGILYITSVSYLTIRSEKQNRAFNIGLCHFFKLLGIALTKTLARPIIQEFVFWMGIFICCSAVAALILQILNEYRQRKGILYNYKDSLDHECSIANHYGKLFSKNEVIIERNTAVSATNLWKSREQKIEQNDRKNYSITWIFYLVTLKLHGAALYFYPLVVFSDRETSRYFFGDVSYLYWIMFIGGLIGLFFCKFMRMQYLYPISLTCAIITLSVSHVFLYNTDVLVFILWLYFLIMSIPVMVPDIVIMEVSKMKYNEAWLAAGCVLEFLPFPLFKFLETEELLEFSFEEDEHLAYTMVVVIVIIVTSLFIILHMPNTFKKSMLKIQNEMLKHKRYFAFQTEPEKIVETPINRAFENIYVVNSTTSQNVFENHANLMPKELEKFDYEREIQNVPNLIPRVRINVTPENPLYQLKSID